MVWSTKEEFIKYFNETYFKLVRKFEPPTQYSAWGAEALLVLLYGISKSGSTDPAQIRATLSKAHFMTFFGEFKMDNATGLNAAHQMIVVQVQKGKGVVVWPPEAAESNLIYPHPGWSAIENGILCGS